MIVEFEGTVFLWDARTEAMHLVAVPAELSADIRDIPRVRRGFGSVRVEAQLGGSRWRTSIFPDSGRGEYVLPLKRAVRDAEGVAEGDLISVRLEVFDG